MYMFYSSDLQISDPTGIAALPLSYLSDHSTKSNNSISSVEDAVLVSDSGNHCIHIINAQTGTSFHCSYLTSSRLISSPPLPTLLCSALLFCLHQSAPSSPHVFISLAHSQTY